ncbi:hypothetical protein ACFVT5_09435 [Streptomyces sp. NPDC058001]|uniref:hypothetical protein n=1 Tax=Streptomyces sp. NPDC058001 TaxID=3346300 RepID=UPI0036EB7F78
MPGRGRRPSVDTWVHICNEIIHHVLPFRTRTVHLLWVVTIPPAVLGGFFVVLLSVLIPNPNGWFGVAGCGAGVLAVARMRTWLLPLLSRRRALRPAEEEPGPESGRGGGAPVEPAEEEEVPTSPLPPRPR